MMYAYKGEFTMRVHDQNVTFNVFKSIQYPITNNDVEDVFHVDAVENIVEDTQKDSNYDDHLDYTMLIFFIILSTP